jgi:hypothetical protein
VLDSLGSPPADGDGRVTGADATKFFAMSGLARADLKQVSDPPCRHPECLELPLMNVA